MADDPLDRLDPYTHVEDAGTSPCDACDGTGHFGVYFHGHLSDEKIRAELDRMWHPWLYPDRAPWPRIDPAPWFTAMVAAPEVARERLGWAWRALKGEEPGWG